MMSRDLNTFVEIKKIQYKFGKSEIDQGTTIVLTTVHASINIMK